MIKAPVPANEHLRVKSLNDLAILDTGEEEEFNNIVQLASSFCNAPIALISLVDGSRQWFKARIGLNVNETPRDISICGHAINEEDPFFQVEDALTDIRFFDNPLVVSEPNIRSYAGVQLVSTNGFKIGMLCVMNTQPGLLASNQVFALKVLANYVARLLELRILQKISDAKSRKIEFLEGNQQLLIAMVAHDAELYQKSRTQ